MGDFTDSFYNNDIFKETFEQTEKKKTKETFNFFENLLNQNSFKEEQFEPLEKIKENEIDIEEKK
jgi:hypothetical protein